jgi:hypothetical protein
VKTSAGRDQERDGQIAERKAESETLCCTSIKKEEQLVESTKELEIFPNRTTE